MAVSCIIEAKTLLAGPRRPRDRSSQSRLTISTIKSGCPFVAEVGDLLTAGFPFTRISFPFAGADRDLWRIGISELRSSPAHEPIGTSEMLESWGCVGLDDFVCQRAELQHSRTEKKMRDAAHGGW
jgi:hypothetical protein